MNNPAQSMVDQALSYANDPLHGGQGYSVEVELDTGRIVEGNVLTMDEPTPGTLVLSPEGTQGDLREVFIDKRRVVSITIIW